MQKPTRFSVAMLISVAALSAAVVVDNDVNDDHGVDAAVTTTAGAPMVGVEDRNDAVDDND